MTVPSTTATGRNTLALVGFILSIVGRLQIDRTGQSGRGLATAGVIIGFAGLVIGIINGVAGAILVSNALNH